MVTVALSTNREHFRRSNHHLSRRAEKRHDGMTQHSLRDPGQSTLSHSGCTSKRAQAQVPASTHPSCAYCDWILWDALVTPRHAHLSTRAPCTDAHRHAPAPSLSYARQLLLIMCARRRAQLYKQSRGPITGRRASPAQVCDVIGRSHAQIKTSFVDRA